MCSQAIKMEYAVVLLQNRKTIVVPEYWVQHKNRKKMTKIYLSQDENNIPNFDLEPKYFIQQSDACYNGFFIGKYREYSNQKERLINF